MRRIFGPSFLTLLAGAVLFLAACAGDADPTDVAAPSQPTPTVERELPSLVPAPSPTPFEVPTIVPTVGPDPTSTAVVDDADAQGVGPTPTVAAAPSATPRPIPTAAPTSTTVPRPAPTAIIVRATPVPVRPTATAIPPTPTATSTWVNSDCYIAPGAADEPAWWCGGKLCWPASPHAGCPTTPPPNNGYVEVGCTISDRSIKVGEVITLKAFQNPANVPITFSFDHGDGTIDQTPESRAFYEAPGRYDVIMRWQQSRQQGRTFCGTVVVTGTAGPTPTPTPPTAVQIGCTVSDRDIVVGQVITLQATQNPANVPITYAFNHGDGTRDVTSRSQAFYRSPGSYQVTLEWAHSGTSGTIGCGGVTVTPDVNVAGYLGGTADQAAAWAANDGLTLRIVRVDDQSFPGTTDYRLDRINIEIDNGIVTKAYLG